VRAIVIRLTHDLELAAASGARLLRARIGALRTLDQRSGPAVRQEQRRTAATTGKRRKQGEPGSRAKRRTFRADYMFHSSRK